MKRFITILLAFLHVTLTSGFTVNAHQCMGKLAAVDFKSHTNDVCNICSKPGKKGKCCKDEYKYCRADISSREVANVQQNSESSVKALSLPVIIVPVPALTTTDLTGINNNHCPVGL